MAKPLKICDHKPDTSLIELLGELLKQAKSGELTDILVVGKGKDGDLTTWRSLDTANKLEFLGYLEWSKWCLNHSIGIEEADL